MSYQLELAVEVALLVAIAWPALRLVTSRQFWGAFPKAARLLAVILAVGVAGLLVAIASMSPWVLRSLCVAAVIGLMLTLWYARKNRGHRRNWPPGSLSLLPLGPWFDRDFFRDQHRQFGCPFKTNQFVRPMACFVGLAEGLDFFRTHEESLASPPWPFGRFIPGGFLRHMAPEQHAKTKSLLRKALAREVYAPLKPVMREQIRAGLTIMAEASGASGLAGVPPRRYLQRTVFGLWARIFFNVEPGSAESFRLQSLFKVIDIRNPAGASDRMIKEALVEIQQVLRQQSTYGRPSVNGAPESFLAALREHCPESADDPTVIGNLIYLMHTTWSDVSGLFQWLMRMLTEHPEWSDRLRNSRDPADPEQDDRSLLSTRVVMETLRLEQSEYLYRSTTRDVAWRGFVIPKGWLVRLCVRESHRDPEVFRDPEIFDPDRFLHRIFTRREYSPFGAGLRHNCLGEPLTLIVGRIFVEELARTYAWQTVADAPYEFSGWRHWRPSSRWRVLMAPLQ